MTTLQIKVSIIIPVYNVKPYLRQCLDSVLAQNEESWEAIVVDDGSTDGSSEICDEYANKDPRFRVFHKENGGVSSARNYALKHLKGEWIWFVDSDDWITPNAIHILIENIESNSTDMMYFGLEQTAEYHIHAEKNSISNIYDTDKDNFLKKVVCNTHQAILYKKTIIDKHHIEFPIDMKMSEDLEFQYKYLLHCKHPIQISPTLYYLRIREGSASHNPNTIRNSLYGNQMILKHMLEYVQLQEDKGLEWVGIRMANRVKNLIKAAYRIHNTKHSETQIQVRYYIDEFRKIGYTGFNSKTMKLAYFDARLYYMLYRLIIFIKSKRFI